MGKAAKSTRTSLLDLPEKHQLRIIGVHHGQIYAQGWQSIAETAGQSNPETSATFGWKCNTERDGIMCLRGVRKTVVTEATCCNQHQPLELGRQKLLGKVWLEPFRSRCINCSRRTKMHSSLHDHRHDRADFVCCDAPSGGRTIISPAEDDSWAAACTCLPPPRP